MNKGISMQVSTRVKHRSIIERMKKARWFMRIMALLQASCFLFVFYSPGIQAAVATVGQTNAVAEVQGDTDEAKLSNALQLIKEDVAETKHTVDSRMLEEGNFIEDILAFFNLSSLQNESLDTLLAVNEQVNALNLKALENFAGVEAMLIAKGLPDQILQRHYDAVSKYQADFAMLQAYIQNSVVAGSLHEQQTAMDELDGFLQGQQFKRTHQTDDPNNLPFGTPKASDTREPVTDPEQLSALIQGPQETRLAEKVLDALIKPAQAQATNNMPTAADLAETIDVQLTDAIRAKALELNNDPVEIYNWVRNNIEFIPSYGSIQGADYTLQHGKGNAFDTASLLIALLRVANIPARYAYGTVDIPVEKAMNWVGGVEVPEAAMQLLGQGGIPNTGLVNGGQITDIRMEQVWVEAWVDYFPSRAAKHITGDNWIPLDASFKQYEYTDGEDLAFSVPFDAQGLIDQITATATVNDTEGYVQGVNQADVEAALNSYQQQVEDYINNQNPDATVGDVLGTQKIIVQEFQQLAAGLPYHLDARTNNYSALPDNLRHKFRYTLGTEQFGSEGRRLITFQQSLPELAGKKHALSFKPATQTDVDLINSYLPEPDPITGKIDINLLTDTLPGYLINLTAEFTQDGEVVHSQVAGTMGSELYETLALWSPSQGWQQAVNHPTAGEYRAIGLDLQGVSQEQSLELQQQIEATQVKLESDDNTQLASLTKHEVVGDMMYATIFSYLALNGIQDQITAQSSNIVQYRAPSYGIFGTGLNTQYWFGLPRNVSFAGLSMDVDRYAYQAAEKTNASIAFVAYNRASGLRISAMEHLVPEQMFSTDIQRAQGVSAVKALAIAGAEGQKIWTITADNVISALASINLSSDTEIEIRNSVNAGKIVTAHENKIRFNDWIGEGYLIIDPETGSGAYKIAGGGNGSETETPAQDALGMLVTTTSGGAAVGETIAKFLKGLGSVAKFFANVGFALTGLSTLMIAINLVEACPVGIAAAPTILLLLMTVAVMTALVVTIATTLPLFAFAAIVAFNLMLESAARQVNRYACG